MLTQKPEVKKITLKEDATLTYTDHLGDRRCVVRKKGEEVYYKSDRCPGWTVHTCWVVIEGYAGERFPRRFEAVKVEYHYPVLTAGKDDPPTPGSLVLAQGRYEGEFLEVVTLEGIFPGTFWKVEYAEGPLCGTFMLTKDIQLLKAAKVKPERKAKRKGAKK